MTFTIPSVIPRRCRAESMRRFALFVVLLSIYCGDSTEPRRATSLAIVVQPTTAQNGFFYLRPIVVEIRDQKGGAFAQEGTAVTVMIVDGGGTLSGPTVEVTNADGRATFTFNIVGTVGPRTLRFSAAGLAAVTSAPIDLTAGPPRTMEAISQTNLQATVGTAVSPLPSVVVKDMSENPVAGVTVRFVPLGSSVGQLTGTVQTTGSSGVATLGGWVLPTTAGQYTLDAHGLGHAGTTAFMVRFIATATEVRAGRLEAR